MMEIIFKIIEIKNDLLLLKDEQGREILWPKNLLKQDFKIGDNINFLVSLDDLSLAKKRQAEKNLLNEMLNTSEV